MLQCFSLSSVTYIYTCIKQPRRASHISIVVSSIVTVFKGLLPHPTLGVELHLQLLPCRSQWVTSYIWSCTRASHSPAFLNIPDVLTYRLQWLLTPYIWNSSRASRCPALPTHRDALQRTATHRNALQRTATHCSALQRTATHCNARKQNKRTASHCNAL